MKTFYFDTGVKRELHSNLILMKGQFWSSNNVKIIPFDCDDVPDNAFFKFACDNPNLPESKLKNWIVREIHNSTLVSKYAYFWIYA